MDRLIQSHVLDFSQRFDLESNSIDKQFEEFSNYCIASIYTSSKIDPSLLTNGDDDTGIDGLFFIFDEELVTTAEEAQAIFDKPKKNREVEVVFIQSKTSSEFKKDKITNFSDAIFNFLQEESYLPQSDFLIECREIFKIIIRSVRKIKDGQPSMSAYFCTTGFFRGEAELEGAKQIALKKVESTNFFKRISFDLCGRNSLIKLWTSATQPLEATIVAKYMIPLDKIDGAQESYLAWIAASEFVDSLLTSDTGKMKPRIFNDNVRSFLGYENSVNQKIQRTLLSETERERFVLLNNGITIVSSDIRVSGANTISITDYQIVNGCQTSHILFRNRELLDSKVTLVVKLIEAERGEIVNQIVEATNKQTFVEEFNFLSLRPKAQLLEDYILMQNKAVSIDSTIYFERRQNQFFDYEYDVPDSKILNLQDISRAFASMFLEVPHTAAAYPKLLTEQYKDVLFTDDHKEICYYCSALTLYKFKSLINGKKIAGNLSKYKWHILMLFKYVVHVNLGSKPYSASLLSSNKIENYCKVIVDALLSKDNQERIMLFNQCVQLIERAGFVEKKIFKKKDYTLALKSIIDDFYKK